MHLHIEIEREGMAPDLPGGGAGLVALMSFALSRGFGAQHPLIALADRLHDEHHLPLGPLTTFYEAGPEDEEDALKLEAAWQDARPLAEVLGGIAHALASDPEALALARRAGAENLAAEAAAAHAVAAVAAAWGQRVRLSYSL